MWKSIEYVNGTFGNTFLGRVTEPDIIFQFPVKIAVNETSICMN